VQSTGPSPLSQIDQSMSSSAPTEVPDEREQKRKRARTDHGDDASVEQILSRMSDLADELRQRGVRVAVLGDGKIVPMGAGASPQGPPKKLPYRVLDSSQSDCLLIVPTSDPQPHYIYACAGGLLMSRHDRSAKIACGLNGGGDWAELLSVRSPLFSSLKSGFKESTTR
jgi:hypothetical protein